MLDFCHILEKVASSLPPPALSNVGAGFLVSKENGRGVLPGHWVFGGDSNLTT